MEYTDISVGIGQEFFSQNHESRQCAYSGAKLNEFSYLIGFVTDFADFLHFVNPSGLASKRKQTDEQGWFAAGRNDFQGTDSTFVTMDIRKGAGASTG